MSPCYILSTLFDAEYAFKKVDYERLHQHIPSWRAGSPADMKSMSKSKEVRLQRLLHWFSKFSLSSHVAQWFSETWWQLNADFTMPYNFWNQKKKSFPNSPSPRRRRVWSMKIGITSFRDLSQSFAPEPSQKKPPESCSTRKLHTPSNKFCIFYYRLFQWLI